MISITIHVVNLKVDYFLLYPKFVQYNIIRHNNIGVFSDNFSGAIGAVGKNCQLIKYDIRYIV